MSTLLRRHFEQGFDKTNKRLDALHVADEMEQTSSTVL
jgi:hypothetical protein